jgi:hypothetical protein
MWLEMRGRVLHVEAVRLEFRIDPPGMIAAADAHLLLGGLN